jgi:hypothetical protein
MSLSLKENRVINEIASLLYDYLPGKPHPYANQEISFEGVAKKLGLNNFWNGGSKLPAITLLLEKTLEFKRLSFCDLILEIIRTGMIYRQNKGKTIKREEIQQLNKHLLGVQFKIPELWDPEFLESLPGEKIIKPESEKVNDGNLLSEFLSLLNFKPQERGYKFEKFLNSFFTNSHLSPKSAFRLVGEQIDGSFELDGNIYLVEAKWQSKPISQDQLLIFREKVESKSTWSRGLFVSESGFSDDGLQAFSRGRSTNIIGMNGQDIFYILSGEISLVNAINQKARWAAETGEFFKPIQEFIK